nr:putative nuclease HARBI1 [Leptinotarsa decemlineata]
MQEIYESGEQAWLIEDSGYPLQPFLMTSFQNPLENSPESRFNHAHIRARNCIERCFGILKMRFHCLLKERTLRYNPDFVASLLKACAVLHNMCVDGNIPIDENVGDPDNDKSDVLIAEPLNNQGQFAVEGMRVRDRIVQQYYQ